MREEYCVTDKGYKTPCWIWQLSRNNSGYGTIAFWRGRTVLAHRYYYEIRKGPIPKGLDLDHLCKTKLCINPDHLEPVSRKENARRGKGTKLNKEQVEKIRQYLKEEVPYRRIAKWFSVSPNTIAAIAVGRSWRDEQDTTGILG